MRRSSSHRSGSSRVLAPHRVLGVVGDGVTPFALQSLGGEPFVTVSVGHAFQVYSVEHLRVEAVSQRMPHSITALAVSGERTFVACGKEIVAWERMHPLARIGRHPGTIVSLLVFGDILVSTCEEGRMKCWDLKHASLVGRKHRQGKSFSFQNDMSDKIDDIVLMELSLGKDIRPTVLMHPDTYLNKVVVGFSDGSLSLWNIRSGKLVHQFKSVGPELQLGGVTAVQQSPALDVVAVGMQNGTIFLLNLKQDMVLFELDAGKSAVTSLSFRTDTGAGGDTNPCPTMASGCADGKIWVWDLAGKKLIGEIAAPLGAHEDRVLSAAFLPQEPVLLSLGADNALRAWIFDSSAAMGNGATANSRLLRSREGHSMPPNMRAVRWYRGGGGGGGVLASAGHGDDATALQLLSGGGDQSLRASHAVRDALSCELSQGKVLAKARKLCIPAKELKMRKVVAIASADARSRDWCDVITAHENDSCVCVWRFDDRVLGPHELRQPHWPVSNMASEQDPQHFATAVAISVCGNYGIVGTQGGIIYRYNMQSGAPRGAYPANAFKVKQNSRKIEAGDVRLTKKKMKILTDGPKGPLRNASGKFVHGKRGVGYGYNSLEASEEAKRQSSELEFASSRDAAHTKSISGVAVDALNLVLLSSSLDGTLRFWSFTNQSLSLGSEVERQWAIIEVGSPISMLEMVRDAGLVACGCDDRSVRVFDVETRRLVRRLAVANQNSPFTDMAFSPDARRLYVGSHDGSLRVWDLPTSKCIDWAVFSEDSLKKSKSNTSDNDTDSSSDDDDEDNGLGPVTSVSVCPTGEFICTSHAGSLGLHLWTDRTLYESIRPEEAIFPLLLSAPQQVSEASTQTKKKKGGKASKMASFWHDEKDYDSARQEEEEEETSEDATSSDEESENAMEEDDKEEASKPKSLGGGLTLSSLARSRWETLFQLDLIRARNKPIEPVKPPPQAPFFLPTLRDASNGLTPTFGDGTTTFSAVGTIATANNNQKKMLESQSQGGEEEGEEALTGWGEAWSDDEVEAVGGDTLKEEDEEEDQDDRAAEGYDAAKKAASMFDQEAGGRGASLQEAVGGSRLLRRTRPLELPRCPLAELLLKADKKLKAENEKLQKRKKNKKTVYDDNEEEEEEDEVLEFMKTLSPSAVDAELSRLCRDESEDEAGVLLLISFLQWIQRVSKLNVDFDLLQAYLHRFLMLHSEVIAMNKSQELQAIVQALKEDQAARSTKLRELVQQNLCLVNFFSNIEAL